MIKTGKAWYLSGFFARNSLSSITKIKAGKTSEGAEAPENERKYYALPVLIAIISLHFLFLSFSSAAETPKRIVSLAPSMTEILFALGLEDKIVGVTSFCDYPPEAKKKAKVGGMSNPSLEAVVSLRPDIVVMTVDGNPKDFEERLRQLNIKTYVSRAKRISELPSEIMELGSALGAGERAEKLSAETKAALDKFKNKKSKIRRRKKILFIIWPEPLIVAGPGSIAADAITVLGGENIASDTRTAYPKYSIEEILRRSPDIIFIGKGHKEMEKVSEGLLKRIKNVPAVKNKKVFYVGDYLYRLGPRTIKGIEELSEGMGDD